MTNKQKQNLLQYLGYYVGIPDDIWGDLSRQATEAFQRAYMESVDGVFGPMTEQRILEVIASGEQPQQAEDVVGTENTMTTGTFWDEIQYFTREEFRCQCGGKYCNGFPVEPDETMVRTVDEIRRRLGVPVTIVESGGSGIRCEKHNASILGAAANSEHLYGRAADLHSAATPAQMKAVAEEVMAEMLPGKGGIGLYSWGIHVDVGKYSRWNG